MEASAHVPHLTRRRGRSGDGAQERVEQKNFDARKDLLLLEYDDVMNQQREVIYALRECALEGREGLRGETWEMIARGIENDLEAHVPEGAPPEQWDLPGLREQLLLGCFLRLDGLSPAKATTEAAGVRDVVRSAVRDAYHRKLEELGDHAGVVLQRSLLSVLDKTWREHLYDLDHLQDTIRYRSYGQSDPVVEYKKEAFSLFLDLMQDLRGGGRTPVPGSHRGVAGDSLRPDHLHLRAWRSGGEPRRGVPGSGRRGARPERPVPLRQRKEVQAVPRSAHVSAASGAGGSTTVREIPEVGKRVCAVQDRPGTALTGTQGGRQVVRTQDPKHRAKHAVLHPPPWR